MPKTKNNRTVRDPEKDALRAENKELRSRLAEAQQHRNLLIESLHGLTASRSAAIGKLTSDQIFLLLREDFATAGKPNVTPTTTFYDLPPTGMGYTSPDDVQNFLNTFVNSNKGKQRYNLGPGTVIWEKDIKPKNVAGLAQLIYISQQ
jgi:hypothetical protein